MDHPTNLRPRRCPDHLRGGQVQSGDGRGPGAGDRRVGGLSKELADPRTQVRVFDSDLIIHIDQRTNPSTQVTAAWCHATGVQLTVVAPQSAAMDQS
jgi:hypothetical protein